MQLGRILGRGMGGTTGGSWLTGKGSQGNRATCIALHCIALHCATLHRRFAWPQTVQIQIRVVSPRPAIKPGLRMHPMVGSHQRPGNTAGLQTRQKQASKEGTESEKVANGRCINALHCIAVPHLAQPLPQRHVVRVGHL